VISLVLIISRLLCAFGAAVFTRVASRFITVADANPGWKSPLVVGWAGMRGVVSLAAALSIPVLLDTGAPFPHRSLILFITFVVILVTLVFQGLTLPWLIRKIKLEDRFTPIPVNKQEMIIQKKIAHASLNYLREQYGNQGLKNEHLDNLLARLQIDLNFFQQNFEGLVAGTIH
jgi:CPA1 family monovalent cation:H+ antiporter